MREAELLVFDDIIYSGATVYTSATFNDVLASHDWLVVMAVVDNVSAGSAAFDLFIEHSCDGRNWLTRNDPDQTFPPPTTYGSGYGDIIMSGMGVNSTYAKMYSDAARSINRIAPVGPSLNSGGPLLGHVRFAMKIDTGFAHVKVYAILRNAADPVRRGRATRGASTPRRRA